jgi:hypothetical protein
VWQQVADATAAATLDAAGHDRGALAPPGALGLPPGRSVEEYYALLTRLAAAAVRSLERCPLDGCRSGADGLRRGYEVRDDDVPGLDETRADAVRKTVAVEFRAHLRSRGSKPGEWDRWVASILEPVVPWQQVLSTTVRRAVAWTHGQSDYTYSRPSRRGAASPHVVLPGLRRPTPGVAVVVDTSASVDDRLLAQALGEVDGVLRALGPVAGEVTVLTCDAAVHAVRSVRSARDVQLTGAGGTDLRPALARAVTLRPRPELLVVLTDGDTPGRSDRQRASSSSRASWVATGTGCPTPRPGSGGSSAYSRDVRRATVPRYRLRSTRRGRGCRQARTPSRARRTSVRRSLSVNW